MAAVLTRVRYCACHSLSKRSRALVTSTGVAPLRSAKPVCVGSKVDVISSPSIRATAPGSPAGSHLYFACSGASHFVKHATPDLAVKRSAREPLCEQPYPNVTISGGVVYFA